MSDTTAVNIQRLPARPPDQRAEPDDRVRCASCDQGFLPGEIWFRPRECCEAGRAFDQRRGGYPDPPRPSIDSALDVLRTSQGLLSVNLTSAQASALLAYIALAIATTHDRDRVVAKVLQEVCELPGYDSPDDQPNLLQCTTDELALCVRRALGEDL